MPSHLLHKARTAAPASDLAIQSSHNDSRRQLSLLFGQCRPSSRPMRRLSCAGFIQEYRSLCPNTPPSSLSVPPPLSLRAVPATIALTQAPRTCCTTMFICGNMSQCASYKLVYALGNNDTSPDTAWLCRIWWPLVALCVFIGTSYSSVGACQCHHATLCRSHSIHRVDVFLPATALFPPTLVFLTSLRLSALRIPRVRCACQHRTVRRQSPLL